MKKSTLIISAAIILTACGGDKESSVEAILASNDLAAIRAKRAETCQ